MNKNIVMILLLSIGVAVVASFFASGSPDGLEKVAEDLGFIGSAAETPGAMPDYIFPGIKSEAIATAIAGIIGIIITFGAFWATTKLIKLGFSLKKQIMPPG